LRVTLLALGCLLLFGVTAQAIPFVPGNFNGLFFTNDEVWVDKDNDGLSTANPGANTVTVGDILWGTLKMNQISGPTNNIGQGGPQIWGPGATPDEITGYFVTVVSGVINNGNTILLAPLPNAALDPNGIMTAADIANGVVIRIYEDSPGGFGNYNATTQGQAVATATDGSLLWTLSMFDNALAPAGIQPNNAMDLGYWFSNANTDPWGLQGGNVLGDSFAGVNVVTNNSGISKFGPVTDPNVTLASPPWSVPNYNHFWLNSELIVNGAALATNFAIGPNQPMHLFSNDPGVYFPIPEPGTVALFGLGLVGAFGVVRRRRRRT
jgi:hypothetical protein